jgi:hypothetical protein
VSEQTIRSMVKAIQAEVRSGNIAPLRAADLQAQLAALMGNIAEEQTEADCEYNDVYLTCLKAEEKANRAKIVAETSPQYKRKREARDTLKLAESMGTALRALVRAAQEEMRMTR